MFERDFYQCLTHSKGVESLSKTNNLMPEKAQANILSEISAARLNDV